MKRYILIASEVILCVFLLIIVGININENDPLLFSLKYSPVIFISLILSLTHGFTGGLTFITSLFLVSTFFYKGIPFKDLLWNLLVVLITAEFRYYWGRKFKETEVESKYIKEKLERIKKELFLLKVSHDKLELNYIVKPYSIRNAISELKRETIRYKKKEEVFNKFLKVISENFNVTCAGIYEYKNGKFLLISSMGDTFEVILKRDPFLEEAFKEGDVHYIPLTEISTICESNLDYLSLIFARGSEYTYLLVIKDMLLSNINEEILTAIHILFSYVVEDVEFIFHNKEKYQDITVCNIDLLREFNKMYKLFKKFNIKSTIILFSYTQLNEDAELKLLSTVRATDTICILKELNIILYILPFTPYLNAKDFSDRILEECEFLKLKDIHEIREEELTKYIKEVVGA